MFASAGADGSIRQFDLRDLQHSSVLYETEKSRPILKLAWNRKQPCHHMLAFIEMEQNYVTVMDIRYELVNLKETFGSNAQAEKPQR
jgi:WD repeat-containing protein 68